MFSLVVIKREKKNAHKGAYTEIHSHFSMFPSFK